MGRRLSGQTVSITVDVPIEVARYVAVHGNTFIAAAKRALADFERDPPPDQAEIDRLQREQESAEVLARLTRIGRLGNRQLRHLEAETFSAESGVDRPKAAALQTWKQQAIRELAPALGVECFYAEMAISKFRKQLQRRIKCRRGRELYRDFLDGLSNKQIAERKRCSIASVAQRLAEVRQAWRDDGAWT